MDYFRRFFGFPRESEDHTFDDRRFNDLWENERSRQHFNFPPEEERDRMGFHIFTNPLEMHKYFEQQVNEFMRMFQMEDHDDFHRFSFSESTPTQTIEDDSSGTPSSGSLRDQYLKPGYDKGNKFKRYPSRNEDRYGIKLDTDLDGKVSSIDDLDSLKERDVEIVPYNEQPKLQFFGQSVQFKTIQHPDGSTETIKIVKDHSGNEEKTVTLKRGDQEHTVITRRDKDGREEVTENMLNLDNNNLHEFWNKNQLPAQDNEERKPRSCFPFDKFF